jgi:hypothetical protein
MDAGDSRQGLVFLMECGHGVPRIHRLVLIPWICVTCIWVSDRCELRPNQLRKAIIFGFLRVGFSLCIPLHNELALGRYHCVAL